MPHVIEPAAGADRATLAFLVDAYEEEVVERDGTGAGEGRTVLRLHPRLAPVKAAVLPLVKKDGQPELAHEVYRALRGKVQAEYDDGGAIGKRYRRQDEIGTPFCVTIDHESLRGRAPSRCATATRSRRSACRSRGSRGAAATRAGAVDARGGPADAIVTWRMASTIDKRAQSIKIRSAYSICYT